MLFFDLYNGVSTGYLGQYKNYNLKMTYQQIIEILQQNSSEKYRTFNDKITNSGVKSIGATVPFIRKLAKSCTLDEVLTYPTHEFYEVDMLKGIVISTCKMPFERKSEYLRSFATTIENWAVCDSCSVKVPNKERESYFEFFCQLAVSKQTFVARYGITNLMDNYLDDNHVEQIFALLDNVTFGEYYVDMAVAWLVATAMAKCRDVTFAYMNGKGKTVLSAFCYNKSLQKMRDSFRISDSDKEWSKSAKI